MKTYKVEWSVTLEAEDEWTAWQDALQRFDRRLEDGDSYWIVEDDEGHSWLYDEETGQIA